MSTITEKLTNDPGESARLNVQEGLEKLERRDWWLWILVEFVLLLLTLAVVSMTFPGVLSYEDYHLQFHISQSVRGLVGLVLLFNVYTIYQQVMIKRLRRKLAEQLQVMIRLQTRAEEFHKLATFDALTGLYNRRYAERRLAAEAARSQRYGRPLTMVAMDLDDFKQINERYGHLAGDQVLKEFASRLNSTIRVSDLAIRMGGDEFVVVLPECPPDRIEPFLERLRPLEVEYHGHIIPVRFSSGWVSYKLGETPEEFLDRADQTLYADRQGVKAHSSETATIR